MAGTGSRFAGGVLAVVLLCVAPRAARDGDAAYRGEHAHELSLLLADLDAYATWCNDAKLFAERNRVFRFVLELAPDDERAHRGLKHKKNRDGTWAAPEERGPVENYDDAHVSEVPARRRAAVQRFYDAMTERFEAEPERYGSALREAVYADVLAVDPDFAEVRALRGEVRVGERWVLRETAIAKAQRRLMKRAVWDAFEGVPAVAEIEPSEAEQGLGVAWKSAFATPDVRVLSTGDPGEVDRILRAAHAVGPFFRTVLGADTPHPQGFTIHLLAGGDAERDAFLAGLPGLTAAQVEFLSTLTGSGIPGTANGAFWAEDLVRRLDIAVRHTVSQFLGATYGITPAHGWVWEGFGLYLTRHLIGTRLTWYVRPTEYALPSGALLRDKLLASNANWVDAGYQVVQRVGPQKLAFVLERDVNSMGTEDMVYAYVLTAYLLEGHAPKVAEILARIGAGERPTAVVEDVLATDVPTLHRRLERWLSERRS
jgi:hypothetical protein